MASRRKGPCDLHGAVSSLGGAVKPSPKAAMFGLYEEGYMLPAFFLSMLEGGLQPPGLHFRQPPACDQGRRLIPLGCQPPASRGLGCGQERSAASVAIHHQRLRLRQALDEEPGLGLLLPPLVV